MIKTIIIECSLTDLMDVLNATGNAKVATEILNGTYEAPSYPKEIIGDFRTTKEKVTVDGVHEEEIEIKEPVIYTALSYDPFTDLVHYHFVSRYNGNDRGQMSLREWIERYERNYQLGA